jgi:hypothetical protein
LFDFAIIRDSRVDTRIYLPKITVLMFNTLLQEPYRSAAD